MRLYDENFFSLRRVGFHGYLASHQDIQMERLEEGSCFTFDVYQPGCHHPVCILSERVGRWSCAAACSWTSSPISLACKSCSTGPPFWVWQCPGYYLECNWECSDVYTYWDRVAYCRQTQKLLEGGSCWRFYIPLYRDPAVTFCLQGIRCWWYYSEYTWGSCRLWDLFCFQTRFSSLRSQASPGAVRPHSLSPLIWSVLIWGGDCVYPIGFIEVQRGIAQEGNKDVGCLSPAKKLC